MSRSIAVHIGAEGRALGALRYDRQAARAHGRRGV